MGANRSQVRTEKSPSTMASLRNLVIGALRLEGEENIAGDCAGLDAIPAGRSSYWRLYPHP